MSPSWGTPLGGATGAECEAPDEAAGTAPEELIDPDDLASNTGFDLSTVTAFFNILPFLISPSKASLPGGMIEGGAGGKSEGPPSDGGGGGGGGGGPAILF